MNIRAALFSDSAAIAELHADSWRKAYRDALSSDYLAGDIYTDRRNLWDERLGNAAPKQAVFVAEENNEIFGFACLYCNKDQKLGSHLDNIHVSHKAKGKGIGSALLNVVARHALSSTPKTGMYLLVVKSNIDAQKFYELRGAKNVGEDVWNAPDGGRVPRFIYAWTTGELPLV